MWFCQKRIDIKHIHTGANLKHSVFKMILGWWWCGMSRSNMLFRPFEHRILLCMSSNCIAMCACADWYHFQFVPNLNFRLVGAHSICTIVISIHYHYYYHYYHFNHMCTKNSNINIIYLFIFVHFNEIVIFHVCKIFHFTVFVCMSKRKVEKFKIQRYLNQFVFLKIQIENLNKLD